jgi:hypothetical protein
VKAERKARARAVEKLRSTAAALPLAGQGLSLSDKCIADVERAAIALDMDYGSDGSVVAQLALPLEHVRACAFSADAPVAPGAKGPEVLVLRGAGKLRPVVGLQVRAGDRTYRGPMRFVPTARLPKGGARVDVQKVSEFELEIAPQGDDLFARRPLLIVEVP